MNKNELPLLDIIKEYEEGTGLSKLGQKYNVASTTIKRKLEESGIKIRSLSQCHQKYKINELFFEKIDTEEKAYFLGFLYADGYMHKNTGSVCLTLSKKDREILEKFSTLLESDRPLAFINSNKYSEKRGLNMSDSFRLNINNRKLFESLEKLGIFQKKSLLLKFPNENQVPKKIIKHFVRGYFDGDGCLVCYIPERNKKSGCLQCDIKILGTIDFVENICKLAHEEIGITTNITKRFKDEKNCYNFQLSGNCNILKFLEWMYKDSTISLKRKEEKMISIIQKLSKRKRGSSRIYIENSKYFSQFLQEKEIIP